MNASKKNAIEMDAAIRAKVDAAIQPPALEGSDKQIAWALDIRARALYNLRGIAAVHAARAAISEVLTAKTSAKWWIDNRALDLVQVLTEDMSVAALKHVAPAQRDAARAQFAVRSDDFARRMIAELDRLAAL